MAQKPYTPLALANFFVEKWGEAGNLEHMKLQKLVYCAHGWWLATREGRIVNESPQVWRHGPVFDSMYHALKPYEWRSITQPQSSGPFSEPDAIDAQDDDAVKLLEWVWKRYGHLSAFQLSDMTHEEGTPWHRCAKENDFSVPKGFEIPDEYIRDEFVKIRSAG